MPPPVTPTPVTPVFASDSRTPAQKAADAIRQSGNASFDALVRSFKTSMKLIWDNDNKSVRPQAVWDALGSDGGKLLQAAALTKELINTIKPGTIADAEVPGMTVGSDGKVTITG